MVNKQVLAVFDFCDTLFDGQSISYYLDFLESRLPIHKKLYSKIRRRLNLIPTIESKKYKEFLLKIYINMSKSKFDTYAKEFYENVIKNRLHKPVIEELYAHKNQGHTIVIVSGGFENYLRYFIKEHKVEHLFCTKLEFVNEKFTGKILENECLGNEKLKQLMRLNLDTYDLENSYVYSDHHSDKPLYDLVGNKIIIKNKQDISWTDNSYVILDVDFND